MYGNTINCDDQVKLLLKHELVTVVRLLTKSTYPSKNSWITRALCKVDDSAQQRTSLCYHNCRMTGLWKQCWSFLCRWVNQKTTQAQILNKKHQHLGKSFCTGQVTEITLPNLLTITCVWQLLFAVQSWMAWCKRLLCLEHVMFTNTEKINFHSSAVISIPQHYTQLCTVWQQLNTDTKLKHWDK